MDTKEEQYGFDANFVNEVPDFFKCIVCHLVLRQPVQVMSCGHRFCKPCYERIEAYSKYLNTIQCCPIDREVIDINQVFEDRAVSRDIGNLQVLCSASSHGCMWRGDLRNLQVHKDDCQFKVTKKPEQTIECLEQDGLLKDMLQRLQKCEESLLEKEKDLAHVKYNIHEMQSISNRKEKEFDSLQSLNTELQNEVEVIKQSKEEMKSLFEKEIIELKNENKILATKVISLEAQVGKGKNGLKEEQLNTILEKQTKVHIENSLKPIKSELSQFGKDVQKTFNELKSIRSHTDKTLNKKSIEITSLTSRVEAAEKALEKADVNELAKHVGNIESLTSHVEAGEKSLENDDVNELATHVANIEQILFSYTPYVENEIKFKWVLSDYKSHFEKGKPVFSPVFYPQLHGYSFKLIVEWFGENKENFGLYLRLCRGRDVEEDGKPFRVVYELAVLNKRGTYKMQRVTLKDLDENKDDCFVILPMQQEANDSFGFQYMFTKYELENYIINDTMYITCTFKLDQLKYVC